MKKLLLSIDLIPFITFSQESYIGELRIDLINCGGSVNITFMLTAIGARWDENYNLTEEYSTASDVINSCTEYAAFDHVLDPSNVNDTFAVALYKISAIENNIEQAYFYCDWRTSDWRALLDVNFKYDVGNKRFRDWGNTQTINYTYQTLWDLTGNFLKTDGLEDYWNNSLAVTNDGDAHPRFVWGPYPATLIGGIVEYRIYRSASHVPGQPPGNFTLLGTVEPYEFEYIDYTVEMGSDYNAKSYYVTCFYEDNWDRGGETSPTNIVEVRLGIPYKIQAEQNNKLTKSFQFQLNQNYPNPFNPLTVITWQSPIDNLVILKVFDVLGREVAELVNTYKEAGAHSVEFNAWELTSGIYIYRIQIGPYIESRKLILQK